MKRILVTNDDGVQSPGLHALAEALDRLGDVTIVAPVGESSAIGHALTLGRPLRLERTAGRTYAVDGTPTDCVNIAVTKVLDVLPDLVVSGINKGYNLGDDVTYSGTVAGALEGALLGLPSIAISLQRSDDGFDFRQAAQVATVVAEAVLRHGLPARTLLNVNVPRRAAIGFKITVQARRNHITSVAEAVDPRNRPYFWIEEGQSEWEPHDQSDYQAVRDGYVSITPLHPDLTNHAALDRLRDFSLGALVQVD